VGATVKALAPVIEPLVIVVVGGIVAAMCLPMFRIFELLEQEAWRGRT